MSKLNFFSFLLLLVLASCSYKASEFEVASDVAISDESQYIQLEPTLYNPTSGFIFYPGGLVEPEAYISLLQPLAERGYRVIILKATADLAIFNVKRASKVIAHEADINHWIVGGHSLGGVVAIKAILDNPEEFDGLILLASYPAEKDDLSKWPGAVLSISAQNDGLTLPADIENGKDKLPQAIVVDDLATFPKEATLGKTIYYEITGGIHGQFGDYGVQKDDGEASITREEQHQIVFDLMSMFFSANGW